MCVTYVGISTRITYEQNICTRAKQYLEILFTHFPKHYIHNFNSYVENITRARWGILKSPKHVESMKELAQRMAHRKLKSDRKNRPGGALQLRLRQYSERPLGPSALPGSRG